MNFRRLYVLNVWKWVSFNKVTHYSHCTSTIFALASGYGKSAISVFRISGPNAKLAVLKMGKLDVLPNPRVMIVRKIFNPQTDDLIDKGMIVWHPGPKSFTGEDYCEFHVHGGFAVMQAITSALTKLPQFRLAEPGEFTKRAFVNDKLDLTEVEGLADLINAETEMQRKQAVRQMTGELNTRYNSWSKALLQNLAHTEAYIDFSEDQNIENNIMDRVVKNVQDLLHKIKDHLNDSRKGERLRSGVNIVIIGEPNVGKSSLLNKICQRPAAIVSPIPGTTRDIVEVLYDIDGYPVHISDTAGLRTTDNVIEKEGIVRAQQRAKTADLILWMIDAKKHQAVLTQQKIGDDDLEVLQEDIGNICFFPKEGGVINDGSLDISKTSILFVINKIDLVPNDWKTFNGKHHNYFPISCLSGENIKEFMNALGKKVANLCANPEAENLFLTTSRHRIHLSEVVKNLESFLMTYENDIVIGAEALRRALHHVGKITGKVSSSEILDVIFKEFCIGK